jgi:hypothetical protein
MIDEADRRLTGKYISDNIFLKYPYLPFSDRCPEEERK